MKTAGRFGGIGWLAGVAAAVWTLGSVTAQAQATRTWDGGGGDDNASTAANWSDNTLPTSTDHIVLDVTSTKNMTWDAGVNGLPGTVASWTQDAAYTGTVTFTMGYTGAFTNFTIAGNTVISNGVWTHTANPAGDTATQRLCVTVTGNLTLGSNATITAVAKGFQQGSGPGKGGLGGGLRDGGGHGGQGGRDYQPKGGGAVYDSVTAPTNLGSGGVGGGTGSCGGGAVRLKVTGLATIDGTITVAGQDGIGNYGGGGGGGSLWIETGSVGGTGLLNADGGNGTVSGGTGGGGGGRIAVQLTGSDAFGSVRFSALGGLLGYYPSPEHGAAGTVYLKGQNDTYGRILVDAGERVPTMALTLFAEGSNRFDSITLTNGATFGPTGNGVLDLANGPVIRTYGGTNPLPARLILKHGGSQIAGLPGEMSNYTLSFAGTNEVVWVGNLLLTNGAVLTHEMIIGETYPLQAVVLTVQGNLTVASGAGIRADARGYQDGQGPGKGSSRGGGGHGGQGGAGYQNTGGGATYDSITAPTNPGSGAGGGFGVSYGGGVVHLKVMGLATIDGIVSVVGQSPTTKGGGSGGSIWIEASTLGGTGLVSAAGGSGVDNTSNGGGGGGRIAVQLTGSDSFGSVRFSAAGGLLGRYDGSEENGAAGTVYLQGGSVASGAGTVFVDNQDVPTNRPFTPLPAFSNATENISETAWVVTNKTRLALVANAAVASLNLSTSNSYFDLAGRTGTVSTLTITNAAIHAETYTAAQLAPLVTDSSPGLTGRLVVLGRPLVGTVIMIR